MYRLAHQLTRGSRSLAARTWTTRGVAAAVVVDPTTTLSSTKTTTATPTSSTIRRNIFSAKEPYTSLEYPMATEPPEITKTIASQVRGQAPKHDKAVPVNITSQTITDAVPADYIQQLRARALSPGVSKIAATIPSEIPPNVPANELARPEILITALDNGVRVVR